MIVLTFLYVLFFIRFSHELNNGLGITPPMGWSTWNHFSCYINETIIRQAADAMVSTGLAAVGYEYVNVDACWQESRDADGTIQPNPKTFPSGMKALADYVHSKGLKFGVYSDRGNFTCLNGPGSLGYETKDANTYAAWGVDYLRSDSCFADGIPAGVGYSVMRDALNASGRPIFYSLCVGADKYDLWPPSVANSWRTADDVQDNWASMITNINQNDAFADKAGPGGWNDPDLMEVGNGGMTDAEYVTHFSLWSFVKGPLTAGCDLTNMSAATLATLTNPEVIAVNQDPLGVQGRKVAIIQSQLPNTSYEVVAVNCSSVLTDPRRRQWTYNSEDGSIRSVFNGRCLTIDRCGPTRETFAVLDDCHIGDPQAQCQGKNQQWTINPSNQTIVTHWNGYCLEIHNYFGPGVYALQCIESVRQKWIWNTTDGTVRGRSSGECLTVPLELEVWAGPLSGGSQAVVLLNRGGGGGSEEITVKWTDIGFPVDHPAVVRDLWARKDIGIFTGNYTSPKIDSHAVMMLNITLTK